MLKVLGYRNGNRLPNLAVGLGALQLAAGGGHSGVVQLGQRLGKRKERHPDRLFGLGWLGRCSGCPQLP